MSAFFDIEDRKNNIFTLINNTESSLLLIEVVEAFRNCMVFNEKGAWTSPITCNTEAVHVYSMSA